MIAQAMDPRPTCWLLLALLSWWLPTVSVAQDAVQADKTVDLALWRAAGLVKPDEEPQDLAAPRR